VPPLTSLSAADVSAVAAAFALGEVVACDALATGTINSNFRLVTGRGPLFLRVNEGKTLAEVAYEADLVDHLAARGVPTPRPVAAASGRPFADVGGKLVTLFPWIEGHHTEAPSPDETRAVGAALARVHLAGEDFPRRRESRYAPALILERARALAARGHLPVDVAAVLGEVIPALGDLPPSRRGVIHGDLFPDNVLFASSGALLLDFEQASDGTLVYDLAVALLSWCWDGDLRADLASAMRAGYEALVPLDDGALFAACRFAALRFTVTRISDVELRPGASPELKRLKDYRDFYRRWRRLEELGPEGLRARL
jgi:homoserine kinase type II